MRFKQEVVIIGDQGHPYILTLQGVSKEVKEADIYLVEAIMKGIQEKELKAMIAKREHSNDILADCTLARFILKYQNFLEKLDDFTII